MNNALKGALWSGLIFPGLGQIALKHYKRGAVIILGVLVSLSIAVVTAAQYALAILEQIQPEDVSISAISDAAAKASSASGSLIFNLALLLVILLWIIGVVDAYRTGKIIDIEKGSSTQTSTGNDL